MRTTSSGLFTGLTALTGALLMAQLQAQPIETGADDFNEGVFPGEAGEGWADPWSFSGTTAPTIIDTAPLDEGSSYLHVDFFGTSGGYRNVLRKYTPGDGNDTIGWKFRLEEDPDDFAANFNSFDDRVHFFARNAAREAGGTDASMSWGLFAVGAAHASGAGAGGTFWLYDNVAGDSAFNAANNLDTGIALTPGHVYTFTVTVAAADQSYTVAIRDEDTGETFESEAPHVFRDLSATASSHTILHFGVRASPDDDIRAFDLDSVSVTTGEPDDQAPTISLNPAGLTVVEGQSALFAVEATGTEPLAYQWTRDGADIPGATEATLEISNAAPDDAGSYTVRVSNSEGTVESDPAVLEVIPAELPRRMIVSDFNGDGPAGEFPGERGGGWEDGWMISDGDGAGSIVSEDPIDQDSPYLNLDLSGSAGGYRNAARRYRSGNGLDVVRWKFRLVESQEDFEANFTTFNDRIHFFARDAFRLDGGTDAAMSWGIYAVGEAHSSGTGAGRTFWVYDNVAGDSAFNLGNSVDSGILIRPGSIYSFEVAVDAVAREYTVVIADETVGESFATEPDFPHRFRDLTAVPTGHTILHFGVRADPDGDVRGFDLDSVSIDAAEPPPAAPTFLVQPADAVVLEGSEVVFSVVVDGTEPFEFQWRKDDADLPGATEASLIIPAATFLDAGAYSVRVSNEIGSETSGPAILTVNPLATVQDAIESNFDDQTFPGAPGLGWVDAWSVTAATDGEAAVTATGSIDDSSPALSVQLGGTAGGYRNVLREYESVPGIDTSLPHVIQWKFRLDEEPSGFESNFDSFDDRVHFFGRNAPRLEGGTDAAMSWAVFAVGAAHSSGVGAGKTFWIYDNKTGTSGFNTDNAVDTGVALNPGSVYDIQVTVLPRRRSYTVQLLDETTETSFASAEPHVFRDLTATVFSHRLLHFGLRAAPDSDTRGFTLDSVSIAPLDEPAIVSDFDDRMYPGEAGAGWSDPWAHSGAKDPEIQDGNPLDAQSPYLHVAFMGTSGGYRNVLRPYESTEAVFVGVPHVIRWKFRLNEAESDFEDNFTTFNDRIHFFARNGVRPAGGTDASMSWAVFAHGDAHSSGAAGGRTFHLYDNLAGDSVFGPDNVIDTGIPVAPDHLFSFEITVNPLDQTYTAFILDHDTEAVFQSSAPHLFRDMSATGTSHNILHFGVRADPDTAVRGFDLDTVTVSRATGIPYAPAIVNLVPADGQGFSDASAGLSFVAVSSEPIDPADISVVINGENVGADLEISGSPTERVVRYAGLSVNAAYTVEINVSNGLGSATTAASFDTFNATGSKLVEAENYNFDAGQFIDDPPPSGFAANGTPINGGGVGYVDLVGVRGIDYFSPNTPTGDPAESYRFTDFVGTRFSRDTPRQAHQDAGVPDYEVTELFFDDWLNYTRTFASGNYQVFLRGRAEIEQTVELSRVTSDPAEEGQTTEPIGVFTITPDTEEYGLFQLTTENGAAAVVAMDGIETVRLTFPEAEFDVDVNYLLFLSVPDEVMDVVLTDAAMTPDGFMFSFETRAGAEYDVQTTDSIDSPQWTTVESIVGDGTRATHVDAAPGGMSRYYRVRVR